jgi:MerR family transcriptional regulator, mercuric resistance operon regulatory protein
VQEGMTIGRLASAAGVNVETIRYYQRRGLLPEPPRPPGGQRRYPPAVLQRLGFIRRAQQLGFSLEEVRRLLDLSVRPSRDLVRGLAERKLEVIEARIAELHRIRERLGGLIAESRRREPEAACPIIEALRVPDSGM